MTPHTGVNASYECFENGTFALVGSLEDVAICVPKQSCKLPEFPKNSATKYGYTHNNTKKGRAKNNSCHILMIVLYILIVCMNVIIIF